MREITTHKVNGLNEALDIHVMDEPGHGGACHRYQIERSEPSVRSVLCHISFQNGPIKEHGVNGPSNEALLAIVRDRLECFQAGEYACIENGIALENVTDAMQVLADRTRERTKRGVEGTHAK